MNEAWVETRSVVVEREIAHPPEKIWRALTQQHLIADWLMTSNFQPIEGHRSKFSADWGEVNCEVIEVEPNRALAYTWVGLGLDSIVTWTLTPSHAGTLLRMEQTGFQPDQKLAFHGAKAGWPKFLEKLEQLLARID